MINKLYKCFHQNRKNWALYVEVVQSSKNTSSPDLNDVTQEQKKYGCPSDVKEEDGIWMKDECILIKDQSLALKEGIVVEAHCRERGRRSFESTMDIVRETYWWLNMEQDIKGFVHYYIRCI